MPDELDLDRQVVLRIEGPMPARRGGLHGLSPGPTLHTASAAPKITLETTKLTALQKEAEAKDPRQSIASIIPIALIDPAPTDSDANAAALAAAKSVGESWGISAVGARYAPGVNGPTGKGVVVAVLDTGIKKDHAAFRGITTWKTRNFLNSANPDDTDVADLKGHGTHCASTIFGNDVEGIRIGVAPGVTTALIAKVLSNNGAGSNEAVLEAMKWAASNGAHIISMSLGFDFSGMVDRLEQSGWKKNVAVSRALQAYRENLRIFDHLVDYLWLDGRLLVAASGNDSSRGGQRDYLIDVSMPAATKNVISVGAFGRKGAGFDIAPFSNINPVVCGPGVDIIGAALDDKVTTKLTSMSGTSMACPHVAGLAALWRDQQIRESSATNADQVRTSLLTFAKKTALAAADQGRGLAQAPTLSQA